MSNKHNTIRYLIENLTDESWMRGIVSNMTKEDLEGLLVILETMNEDIQQRWFDVIKTTNVLF